MGCADATARFVLQILVICRITEHVEAEELRLIFGVLALNVSVGNLTALDKLGQTDKLAKLALEVEAVTFVSYEEYIALTGIDLSEECLNVNVV